jgi:hypothetical protein
MSGGDEGGEGMWRRDSSAVLFAPKILLINLPESEEDSGKADTDRAMDPQRWWWYGLNGC